MKPRNFKKGDKVICVEDGYNPHVREQIEFGKEYIVGGYNNGNCYAKSCVRLEGCGVWWYDDRFQLSESAIIDVDYVDVTNQKLLNS